MEEMKMAELCADQGDIRYLFVGKVPDGLVATGPASGQVIVARSDMGHHHVVTSPDNSALLYRVPGDDLTMYVSLGDAGGALCHLKDVDAHQPHRLRSGAYLFRRQREETPDGFKPVED